MTYIKKQKMKLNYYKFNKIYFIIKIEIKNRRNNYSNTYTNTYTYTE